MKMIYRILAVTTLSASLIGPMSFAQDHPDEHHDTYVRHDDWKKGYHMKQEDWNRVATHLGSGGGGWTESTNGFRHTHPGSSMAESSQARSAG